MICIKFTQDPGIKLFCIKCGLQVEISLQRFFFQFFADLSTCRKYQGTCNSEMCKHHLAKIFIEDFFSGFHGQLDISKGKALEFGYIIFFRYQRYQ